MKILWEELQSCGFTSKITLDKKMKVLSIYFEGIEIRSIERLEKVPNNLD